MLNPAFCAQTGYSSAELLNTRLFDLLPTLPAPEGMLRIMRDDENNLHEVELRRKNSSRFFAQISGSPLIIKNHVFVLSIARDISERRKMEEQLRKAKEKAEIANQVKNAFPRNPPVRCKLFTVAASNY